jgi:hypothetical protein
MQPYFPCVAVSVRVKNININCTMPAACRFAVMVKDPIKLVMRWL